VQGLWDSWNRASLEGFRFDLEAGPEEPWAGVLVVSLDGKPLTQSAISWFSRPRRRKLRTGVERDPNRLEDPGQAPVTEQWVKATVTLKVAGKARSPREPWIIRGNRASPAHFVQTR